MFLFCSYEVKEGSGRSRGLDAPLPAPAVNQGRPQRRVLVDVGEKEFAWEGASARHSGFALTSTSGAQSRTGD